VTKPNPLTSEWRKRQRLKERAERRKDLLTRKGCGAGYIERHKPRKVAQVIDRGAVMPAARLFAAGIISRAEMMARISVP
jgi:hypothetical protein